MPEWTEHLRPRLASLRLSPTRELEIVDELAQHLDQQYEELRAGGASDEDARRLALEGLSDPEELSRRMRTLRQARVASPIAPGAPRRLVVFDLAQDLRYAVRAMRKQPGFIVCAVLILALGIGANTAVFSLVNGTLFRQLPVKNRDRLFYLFRDANGAPLSMSYPSYAMLRDGVRLAESLVAWGGITASLSSDGDTDLVSGAIVTGRYFDTLGVSAFRGRLFAATDDETPGAHRVAVISHRLWQRRFGGRSDIAGHEVRLNGQPFTIVGVTRADFPGAEPGVWHDLYVPMMMQASMRPPRAGYSGEMDPDLLKNPNNGWLSVLALLKPGVSREQARDAIEALATANRRGPAPTARRDMAALVPIDDGRPGERRQLQLVATLLGGVVGAVLLIACANIANLLLSNATARRREVAIRLALGADRFRLFRQLITESVLLALIGGAAGVLVAIAAMQLFTAMPPPLGALPIAIEASVDRRVLLFSIVLSITTGIAFGLAPALQASRPGLVPALKDGSLVTEGVRRFSLRNGLVIVEVALSVVLLIAAGLFIRSLRAIQAIDPGVAVTELVSAPIDVSLLRYTRSQGREFYRQLIDRIEALPGVSSATVTRIPLVSGTSRVAGIRMEGRAADAGNAQSSAGPLIGQNAAFANVVGPDFFETVGVPLVMGRGFRADDLEDHPLVAIVSESMARQFFPGEDPIGRRFSTGFRNASGEWTEIVGVARDSKYAELSEGAVPVVYLPLSQRYESGVTLYVRSTMPAATLVPQIRREIQQLEPSLPAPDVRAMDDAIRSLLYPQRMSANFLVGFGGLAVLLAALGVYGVLAFSIAQRRHELAVRMAVGADRPAIFALVIREGLLLVAIGLLIGLIAGANLTQLVATFLFGISALDAVTFAMVPFILALVALVACYVPARRATRVDPVAALRNG